MNNSDADDFNRTTTYTYSKKNPINNIEDRDFDLEAE